VLQPVRGTRDLFPPLSYIHHFLVETARNTVGLIGFEEVELPIFEDTQVFHRLGEDSDVVSKETYTFTDRGGDSLTLRPEGTAGLVRAVISNGKTQDIPGKYFYAGPMFRYDRPQKGRYRQFTQIGIELLGVLSPLADVDVIATGYHYLKRIGCADKVTLELNSIGTLQERQLYIQALVNYLTPLKTQLSPDSQRRLTVNPLRILDSKEPQDQALIQNAPRLSSFLSPENQDFFQEVCGVLTALEIPFVLNPFLVRGLDYYCQTTFEFTTTHLGAQSTVLAGGRYDGLVEQMGGPALPGIGWAAGIDRLALLIEDTFAPESKPPVAVLGVEAHNEAAAWRTLHALLAQGIRAEGIYSGNLGKKMKKAHRLGAIHTLVIGDEEEKTQRLTLKNFQTGTEQSLDFSALVAYLKDID
jgi:histidyl-tRNA synthetase